MAEHKIQNSTTTDFGSDAVTIPSKPLDTTSSTTETYWYFSDAATNIGRYKTIPELKQAVDALARWTAGRGYETDIITKVDLNHVSGWGEDTFASIITNMLRMKKIVGDAFAEIIRVDKRLVNIKPLSPERVRVVVDKKGIIQRYDYLTNNKWKPIEKKNMLHFCNDRLGDEIHGISAIDACAFIIEAKKEAMDIYRKVLRRQLSLGIMYVDSDDLTKINQMITKYQDAAKKGEVLVLPKDVAEIKDAKISIPDFLSWIGYLDNFFYQALGIPKIITGGSQEYTEASSKVGYLTFEQVYMSEQMELEKDLKAQLGVDVRFERPVSLKEEVQQNEAANTGQLNIQPSETQAQVERTA